MTSDRSRQPRVAIVILNWNGWRHTIECLESVFRLDYGNFRVVLCDNASTDGSVAKIHDWLSGRLSSELPAAPQLRRLVDPPARKPIRMVEYVAPLTDISAAADDAPLILIRNATNAGFAGGTNVGLQYVESRQDFDLVWILNNDIVVAPDALTNLVERLMESDTIGAVGPTLFEYHAPDMVQIAGGGTFDPWRGFPRNVTRTDARDLDYVTGGSLLMRVDTLRRIGMIDERFFMYGEDVDFSLRMQAAGLRLAYAPASKVWHKGSAAMGYDNPRHDYYTVRNNLFLVKKYFPAMVPVALAYAAYRCVLPKIVRHQWKRLRAVQQGIGDYWRGVGGKMPESNAAES